MRAEIPLAAQKLNTEELIGDERVTFFVQPVNMVRTPLLTG